MTQQVHHRIPLEWAHIFPNMNPNRLSNLQIINEKKHNGVGGITAEWRQFKTSLQGKVPTQKQILDEAARIDAKFKKWIQDVQP